MNAIKTILLSEAIERLHADHDQGTHGNKGGYGRPETINRRKKLNIDEAARLLKQRGLELGKPEQQPDFSMLWNVKDAQGAAKKMSAKEIHRLLEQ